MVKYRNICAVTNCQKNGSKESVLMHSLDCNTDFGKLWYLRAKYGLINFTELDSYPYSPLTKRVFICEKHFLTSDYDIKVTKYEKNGRKLDSDEEQVIKNHKRLKKTAIPSLNLPHQSVVYL